MKREFSLSPEFQSQIEKALGHLGVSLTDSSRLAESVLRLSDFFISQRNQATPWKEKWAQIGYLSYFLPLNFIRNQAAIEEGKKQGFFNGLQEAVDFGSGPGTAALALKGVFAEDRITLVEKSSQALEAAKNYFGFLKTSSSFDKSLIKNPSQSLAVFSYSLTELNSIPAWALECEALMILEPSTQQDGRRLQAWRGDLIKKKYFAWAPCPHQQDCPLLVHSKKDWCHDRVFFNPPEWFSKMENHLPMKNRTLTYSYLLARRKSPNHGTGWGRLVGDQLEEKGKSRQMFCRNQNREFLAWLHRDGSVPEHHRGEMFTLPPDAQEVSNEIRLKGS